MRNNNYWKKRFEQMEEAVNKRATSHLHTVERQFNQAQRDIEQKVQVWYQRFADNNEISMQEARKWLNTKELAEFKWDVKDYIKYGEQNELNHMWMQQLENASAKYHISRLEALKLQVQQSLEVAYGNQLDDMDSLMKNIYSDGYYHTIFEMQKGFNIGWDIASIDQRKLEKIISKPWAVDGKNFSNRIWDNKSKLVNELHNELSQMVITGSSPDAAINNIAKKMNTSKNNAGRLVMTESAYFASASQKEAFNDLDVERFEIVATLDSSTSEICRSLDGKVFEMKDYQPGVTAPPFHVWCRTTTVPYFDDEFSLGERAARDEETGQTYYVPSNMKYYDWKNSFVNGGSKDDLEPIKDGIIGLKDNILEKHKEIFDKHAEGEAYEEELMSILDNASEDDLLLYDRLSDHVRNNDYSYNRGAHYTPMGKKVNMDMKANIWENRVGTGRKGAFGTKFHEEFHQLDDLLTHTKFTTDPMGNSYSFIKLTSIETEIGSKMFNAIQEDVLNAVNKSIDWANVKNGTNIKHLKSLNRISSDARRSFFSYLKETYPTNKDKAQISMFTDAMGGVTNARLSPQNNGYWGHENAYYTSRGKSVAASEAWAEFGSYKFVYDNETKNIVKNLMPETLETFEGIYKEVVEYARDNPLEYIRKR